MMIQHESQKFGVYIPENKQDVTKHPLLSAWSPRWSPQVSTRFLQENVWYTGGGMIDTVKIM